VITTFKHKGLKKLFEDGTSRGIAQDLVAKATRRLDAVNAAVVVTDLNLPGFDLHELKGNRAATWSIKISGNWRITFRFENGDAQDVDLEDYH